MSDNGYGGGGYDPYSFYGGANAYDPYAGLGNNLYDYSYLGTPAANLGYSGGSATGGGLYNTPAASYGGGGADNSNPYYLGDSGAGPDYGGGTRDFWDRAGDWLAKPGVQRGFAELGGLGQGLLQGSGPSLQPRNFYSALGQGMAGAQTAGAAYDTSQLTQAQIGKLNIEAANTNVWNQALADQAQRATGLPPGYGAGYGTSGGGQPPAQAPAATPTSAGYGGGTPTSGGGGFASVEPHIFQYENATKDAYIGTGGTPLKGYVDRGDISETGFPQWQGKVVGTKANGDPLYSTAAGLYQITKSTWDPIATQLGIKDFSPESQRRVAEELYNQRGLQPWLVGNPAFRNAAARGLVPGQAGSAAMAGGNVAAPLRDTPFQMPSNMAAGLGGPGGILPQAPPAPPITQPPTAPVATLAGASVAPAPLIASAPAAAEPPAARGGESAAVFEGAGNVANINRNLENNPNYYRDKVVVLTPVGAGAKLDKLPDQIASVKEAGGQPVLQAGSNPKQNARMAAIAAKEGVPYREPNAGGGLAPGADTGGGGGPGGAEIAPVPANPEPSAAGNVPGAVPAAIAPPAVVPAVTVPPTSAPGPAAAGPLATGGALRLPPGAPVAPAAGPTMRTGTAAGVPQPPPAMPPAMPPAPPPGGTVAGPAPVAAIPAATAGARPPVPMPAVIQAQPLPLPNLPQPGSAGVPGMPAYDVEAARRAQVLGLAASATGHTLPAYLAGQADLPNKAVAQQWEMQKTLYGAQLTAVSDQWKAANDAQKEAIAAQNGLTKAGYESTLRTQENEWDKGRMIGPDGRVILRPGFTQAESEKAGAVKGAELGAQLPYDVLKDYNTIREKKGIVKSGPDAGAPTTRYISQAQLDAEEGRPPPPAVAAAMGIPAPASRPAPPPAGTVAPGAPSATPAIPAAIPAPATPPTSSGDITGLSPVQTSRIEGDKAQWQATAQQHAQANNLRPFLDQVIEMANKTPSGWSVPVTRAIAQGLSSVGLPVSESMSNAEVMKSISQALIPTVRQPGSQSNAEMTNYLSTVPGLSQSPAGRIQIANMNKAMIDRLGEIAEVRRDNLGAADLHEKLAALDNKPLFNPGQKAVMVAAMGQRAPTDAEFDLLPIGVDYTNRQGQRKTKLANRTPAQ